MRDILLFLIVAGGIPFILRNPAVGIYYWVWLSLMNPHRLTWGFAYSLQFAFVVAAATVISLFLTREPLANSRAVLQRGCCSRSWRGCA